MEQGEWLVARTTIFRIPFLCRRRKFVGNNFLSVHCTARCERGAARRKEWRSGVSVGKQPKPTSIHHTPAHPRTAQCGSTMTDTWRLHPIRSPPRHATPRPATPRHELSSKHRPTPDQSDDVRYTPVTESESEAADRGHGQGQGQGAWQALATPRIAHAYDGPGSPPASQPASQPARQPASQLVSQPARQPGSQLHPSLPLPLKSLTCRKLHFP